MRSSYLRVSDLTFLAAAAFPVRFIVGNESLFVVVPLCVCLSQVTATRALDCGPVETVATTRL